MSRLKIAFLPLLLPRSQSGYQAAYQRFMAPLGPLSLASYLESLDLPLDLFVHDDVEEILKFQPDVVGLSSVSENFGYAQNVAKRLKEKNAPFTILGGPHFTSLPEFLPEGFDVGVIGEGELVLEQIVRTFLCEGISLNKLKTIPSLVWEEEGKLKSNPRSPQVQDLNTLPLPHRKRWVKSLGVPHMVTTRGCIYKCFFCSEPNINKAYRETSAQKVLEEIEGILSDYPDTHHIRFYDDIFTVNRKRMRELCELLEARGIPKRISFSCFVHAKLVDEELVDLLKRMNFSYVMFGAESGSTSLLQKIKPASSVDVNQKALDICHRKGLNVWTTFIVGTPQETAEDLKNTYQFIRRNRKKIFAIEINPALPLPATELWTYATQKGLLPSPEKMNWDSLRDAGNIPDLNLDRYLYLAEKVPPSYFQLMTKKMWDLAIEINGIHGTERVLKDSYLKGYRPASFLNLKSSSLDLSQSA